MVGPPIFLFQVYTYGGFWINVQWHFDSKDAYEYRQITFQIHCSKIMQVSDKCVQLFLQFLLECHSGCSIAAQEPFANVVLTHMSRTCVWPSDVTTGLQQLKLSHSKLILVEQRLNALELHDISKYVSTYTFVNFIAFWKQYLGGCLFWIWL